MNYHVKQFSVTPTPLPSGETLANIESWLAEEGSAGYELHSIIPGNGSTLVVVTKKG